LTILGDDNMSPNLRLKILKLKVPKQIETGTFIGGIITLLQRCQFYFSMLNFLMILATFYYTTMRHVIPISFLLFVTIMAGLLFVLMLIEYVIIYPSFVAFQNYQAYLRNPLTNDVLEIKREVAEIKKILMNCYVNESNEGG